MGGSGSPWWTAYFPKKIANYKYILCHSANYQYTILKNNNGSWICQQAENHTYRNVSTYSIEFAQTQYANASYRAYAFY